MTKAESTKAPTSSASPTSATTKLTTMTASQAAARVGSAVLRLIDTCAEREREDQEEQRQNGRQHKARGWHASAAERRIAKRCACHLSRVMAERFVLRPYAGSLTVTLRR